MKRELGKQTDIVQDKAHTQLSDEARYNLWQHAKEQEWLRSHNNQHSWYPDRDRAQWHNFALKILAGFESQLPKMEHWFPELLPEIRSLQTHVQNVLKRAKEINPSKGKP